MPFGFDVEVRGVRRAVRNLRQVEPRLRKRILVIALSKGGGIFKRAIARRSPRRTGLLGKSWRVKRAKTRDRNSVNYRVQPKSSKRLVERTRSGRLIARGAKRTRQAPAGSRFQNPARYAHLVELGHRLVRGGRAYGRVPGKEFAKPAFIARRRVALKAISAKIKTGIERTTKP